MINMNLEQLLPSLLGGNVDLRKIRPLAIGIVYNDTIAYGTSKTYTYTAPQGSAAVIVAFTQSYGGGNLAVSIRDNTDQTLITTVSNATSANVPIEGIARPVSGNGGSDLTYPIFLQPNASVSVTITNTSATTNATSIQLTALGLTCPM